MPSVLENLEPRIIWSLFEEISRVPRPSKKEEKIREWVRSWAITHHGIKCKEDNTGNILLIVSASEGCEDYPTLILQAHMDMVCQKVPESPHNFEKDPIPLKIEKNTPTIFGQVQIRFLIDTERACSLEIKPHLDRNDM